MLARQFFSDPAERGGDPITSAPSPPLSSCSMACRMKAEAEAKPFFLAVSRICLSVVS